MLSNIGRIFRSGGFGTAGTPVPSLRKHGSARLSRSVNEWGRQKEKKKKKFNFADGSGQPIVSSTAAEHSIIHTYMYIQHYSNP